MRPDRLPFSRVPVPAPSLPKISNGKRLLGAPIAGSVLTGVALFASTIVSIAQQNPYGLPVDIPSEFSNVGSVGNTRHNLTQRQASGGGPNGSMMDGYRNDYGEVCVYCHTPHGANTATTAPLWNRLLPAPASFTTYTGLESGNAVTTPGANSLPCLSCHDGLTAIDAVLNMPGSGRYSSNPDGDNMNSVFLNTWSNPSGYGPNNHLALKPMGCLACHSPEPGNLASGATDFRPAMIGKDLRDDHPIGVRFPGGSPDTTGFRTGAASAAGGKIVYYDSDSSGKLSKGDPRFYDTGGGPMVECASCHDPHGVAPNTTTQFYPTFLRVSNAGSALCLACHAK